jgi:O-antigen/teichoic acid export membrane protein
MPAHGTVLAEHAEQKHPKMVRLTSPLVVARNSFLNLSSEVWTVLVIFTTMPVVIRTLGKDAFGLFSLAWVVLGYMTMLDFGVSRAATKFVSEHLSKEQHRAVERVCRTAIASNLVLGVFGGAIVLVLTPWLTNRVFRLPQQLQHEARTVFFALSLSIPILLIHAVLRAVLSSYQKFGWISFLNSLAVTIQWGGACLLAVFGYRVDAIVIACVGVRAFVMAGYAIVLARIDRRLLGLDFSDFDELWRLLRFGGWVTISQLMAPILIYLDRILIASLISVGTMTIYVVPYEVVSRLRVVPQSLANTLFPSLSEHSAAPSTDALLRLYSESLKYLLLILLPCFLLLGLFGSEIISAWVGPDFAESGGRVLRILALGALLNSLAFVPYSVLVALGRPDIPAKFHLSELPLYLALSFILIPRWGVAGAAWAVSIRLALDAVALFWAARKYVRCAVAYQRLWRPIALNLAAAVVLGAAEFWPAPVRVRLCVVALCSIAYVGAAWFLVLRDHERPLLTRMLRMGDPAA